METIARGNNLQKKLEVSSEVGIFVVDSQQIVEGITAHYCHRIKKTEVTMRVRFS